MLRHIPFATRVGCWSIGSKSTTFEVDRSEFDDQEDGDWAEQKDSLYYDETSGLSLSYRTRIGTKRLVSKEDFDRMSPEETNSKKNTDKDQNLTYEEKILKKEGDLPNEWAYLQSFKHEGRASKAILLGGTMGAFYYRLFNDSNYDLYVLNYRSTTSPCLNKGWETMIRK